jgi:asparagine synthase (glutamine-hydrolysing)
MCGINIIINITNEPVKESLQAMQDVSRYRGPDDAGLFVHEKINWHIGVGVNRLQVIDKDEDSNQPMISTCGNFILAYNGEIYNYQELKNQLLSKGYKFKTHSDTEVALYWLEEYGAQGSSAFKGMFALVFVDLEKKQVVVTRDRHGIKPLFYYLADNKLIISSSINAIEESGLVNLTINNNAITDYLSYRHVMGNYTFYQEVHPCKPGVVNVYDEKLSVINSDMKAHLPEEGRSFNNILADTASLLFEAPTSPGLMLSGGIDSTLLLAILSQELGFRGINTYTLETGSDRKWAKKASVQYNSQHYEIPVSMDTLQRMDDFLENTDQPIADHGAFATWLVAEEAAKNTNVLLSGAGADELFGGYNRHRAYHYYLKYKERVLTAKASTAKIGIKNLFPRGVQQFLDGVNQDEVLTYHNFLQNYAIDKKAVSGRYWRREISINYNMVKALEFDRKNYLVADVLAITDNATMQHGIETRVPYLYDDIVDYSSKIYIDEKMKQRGKGPLKDLLAAYGGEDYIRRKKQGFGLPVAGWLRNKKSLWLWEFLISDSPIFAYVPKHKIYELLRSHQQGKMDNNMQLWSILVLEKWLTRFYK